MTLDQFNQLDQARAADHLRQCCVSEGWIEGMLKARPFDSLEALYTASSATWLSLDKPDYLQAFEGHPKIGDVGSLRAKYANTKALAAGEQTSVNDADEALLQDLAKANADYEACFGYIFIVCATGKSAQEMLTLLKERLNNDPSYEIYVAAAEQLKITQIRLQKLFTSHTED